MPSTPRHPRTTVRALIGALAVVLATAFTPVTDAQETTTQETAAQETPVEEALVGEASASASPVRMEVSPAELAEPVVVRLENPGGFDFHDPEELTYTDADGAPHAVDADYTEISETEWEVELSEPITVDAESTTVEFTSLVPRDPEQQTSITLEEPATAQLTPFMGMMRMAATVNALAAAGTTVTSTTLGKSSGQDPAVPMLKVPAQYFANNGVWDLTGKCADITAFNSGRLTRHPSNGNRIWYNSGSGGWASTTAAYQQIDNNTWKVTVCNIVLHNSYPANQARAGAIEFAGFYPLRPGTATEFTLPPVPQAPAPEPIPSVCRGTSYTDYTGTVIPAGPDWRNPAQGYTRQPARELTQEEKEGDRVYVVASKPSAQERHTSGLYYQTAVDKQFTQIGRDTGWIYNALAFNPKDNWLYAISQPRYGQNLATADKIDNAKQTVALEDPCFPAGHLLQINPATGATYDLGKVTGGGPDGYGFGGNYNKPWPNDLWGGINVGFFDQQNDFWVTNASLSGTGILYKVNLDAVSAQAANLKIAFGTDQWDRRLRGDWCTEASTPQTRTDFNKLWDNGRLGCNGILANRTNIPGWEYRASAEDYTYVPQFDQHHKLIADPANNYAWGIQNEWASNPVSGTNRVYMERINLATGEVRRFDVTNLTTQFGAGIPTGHQWGKAWFYGDGTLGFSTSSTGANATLVQIQINDPTSADPTFELVSVNNNAPNGYNSNGTSATNPYKPRFVDLDVDKIAIDPPADAPADRAYWKIRVTNVGPDTSTGFHIEDNLADGKFTDFRPHNLAYGQGQPEPKFTITESTAAGFQMTFDSLAPGHWVEVTFSAQAPTSAGCFENTASVRGLDFDPTVENNWDTDGNCSPEITKNVIGADGGSVRYELIVTGPKDGRSAQYSLSDMPQFTSAVKATRGRIVEVTGDGAYTQAAGQTHEWVDGERWTIVPGHTIASGGTHRYVVEVAFDAAHTPEPDASLECRDEPGSGLYNTAYLTYGERTLDDAACAPVPEGPNVDLAINKIDADSNVTLPETKFGVFAAEVDGDGRASISDAVVEQMGLDPTGTYFTAGSALKLDTPYFLVETAAQDGYSLLPEPVVFRIVKDTDGTLTTKFYEPGNVSQPYNGGTVVGVFEGADKSRTTAFIQVANVTQGTLPKTGGAGAGWPAAFGSLLVLAGTFLARRRV